MQNRKSEDSSIDTENLYKIVQDAFGDINTTYSAIRKSALEMIASRPFYALASAAVIGVATGLVLRNQIEAAKTDSKMDIAKH